MWTLTPVKGAARPIKKAHLQTSIDEGKEQRELVSYRFVKGEPVVIGRQGPGDHLNFQSISRRHATLSVSDDDDQFFIQDSSTLGTFRNGHRLSNQKSQLNEGDILKFGTSAYFQFRVSRFKVVACCTRVAGVALSEIKNILHQHGFEFRRNWSSDCTHVIASDEPCQLTPKIICALACGQPIVRIQWFRELINNIDICSTKQYPPMRSDTSPHAKSSRLLCPTPTLFQGITFVFLSHTQKMMFESAIHHCGGHTQYTHCDTSDAVNDFIIFLQSFSMVVCVLPPMMCEDTHQTLIRDVITACNSHSLTFNAETMVSQAILNNDVTSLKTFNPRDSNMNDAMSTLDNVTTGRPRKLPRLHSPAHHSNAESSLHTNTIKQPQLPSNTIKSNTEKISSTHQSNVASSSSSSSSSSSRANVYHTTPKTLSSTANVVVRTGSFLLAKQKHVEQGDGVSEDYVVVPLSVGQRLLPLPATEKTLGVLAPLSKASGSCGERHGVKTFRKALFETSFADDRQRLRVVVHTSVPNSDMCVSDESRRCIAEWNEEDEQEQQMENMFKRASNASSSRQRRR